MGKTEAQLRPTRRPSARELKAEIEHTRDEMDRTVDALTEQLQLRHLVDNLLGKFKSSESGRQAGSAALRAGKWALHGIGQHPVPSALIGAGVAWLIMEETRSRRAEPREPGPLYHEPELSGEYLMSEGFEKTTSPGVRNEMGAEFCEPTALSGESAGQVEESKGRIRGAASRVKAKASHTAEQVSEWSKERLHRLGGRSERARGQFAERGERMRHDMRDRMERVKSRMSDGRDRASELLEEYPLVVGLSAMAVGLLVGLSIPPSRRERRLIGPKATEWREKARETAEHVMERGKETARATAQAARREAERQGLTGEGIKESIKEVARSAGSTAEQEGLTREGVADRIEAVAEEATETMKEEIRRENEHRS